MNPELKLIALQEEGWDSDFLQECGGKIYTVYLYDSNQVTYCCEFTPSYALYYVETFPQLEDPSDELLDQIEEAQQDKNVNVDYYHCCQIDKIPFPSEYHRRLDFDIEGGEDYNRFIDRALEYVNCNGGLYAGNPKGILK